METNTEINEAVTAAINTFKAGGTVVVSFRVAVRIKNAGVGTFGWSDIDHANACAVTVRANPVWLAKL